MMTRTRTSFFTAAIALAGLAFVSVASVKAADTNATPNMTPVPGSTADIDINVDDIMQDRAMGDENAPVTVVEYASMTCMHCASFHNTVLPALKKELIDTGKLRLVFREFPLDGVALRASMIARCAPEDKFFSLIEMLFANQKRWVGAENPVQALTKLSKLSGMSEERVEACLANKELETAILEGRQKASTDFNVRATPSFVFDDGQTTESGVIPADDFTGMVESRM